MRMTAGNQIKSVFRIKIKHGQKRGQVPVVLPVRIIVSQPRQLWGRVFFGLAGVSLVIVAALIFLPKSSINPASVIDSNSVVVKQTSSVVVGQPVTYTMLIKKSVITQDQYLAPLPAGATNVTIKSITDGEAKSIVSQKTKMASSLTSQERKQLVSVLTSKSIFAKWKHFFIGGISRAMQPSYNLSKVSLIKTKAQSFVNLSAQSVVLQKQKSDWAKNPFEKLTSSMYVYAETVDDVAGQESVPAEPAPVLPTEVVQPVIELPAEPIINQAEVVSSENQDQNIESNVTDPASVISEEATADQVEPEVIVSPQSSLVPELLGEVAGASTEISAPEETATPEETITPEEIIASEEAVAPEEVVVPTEEFAGNDTVAEVIQIDYELDAPKIVEQETETGKEVTISAENEDPEKPLTDVLAFTEIPEIFKVGQERKIQIKWKNNDGQIMPFAAHDVDGDGLLDRVDWIVPHLSEQIFEIIFISRAFLLDGGKNIVADIYDQVQTQDNTYASIQDHYYLRTTFDVPLTGQDNITLYAKADGLASLEVYPIYINEEGGQTISETPIATLENIKAEGSYKIPLASLSAATDQFDIKVNGGIFEATLQIDYINSVDFTYSPNKILTPAGYKNISELNIGDEVIGYDHDSQVVNTVENIEYVSPEGAEVTFNYYLINETWELFKNQSIWANDNVIHASNLKVGDIIYDANHQEIKVQSVRKGQDHIQWIKFRVSGNHSYVSDGLLLHNATRYWVGSAGGNTGDTANWAATDPASCTGGGSSVPVSTDTAIFDADCDNNATVNTSLTLTTLTVNSGYSGTITVSAPVAISGDLTVNAGTISGTSDITVSGGDVTGDGTISMTNGRFLLDGTGNFGGATAWSFYKLTFGDGSGTATTTSTGAGAITVSNNLTIAASQTLDAGSTTWNLSGVDVAEATTAVDASSPVRWTGTPLAATPDVVSASFTAPVNSLLVATIQADDDSVTDQVYTVFDSSGLTWTQQVKRGTTETTAGGNSWIFTARATSSISRTVNFSLVSGQDSKTTSAKLYVLTGVDIYGTPVDTVGGSNEGGSGTNNLTTSSITPGANGLMLVSDAEWNDLGVETSSDLTLDTANLANLSVASGYKTATSGVGVTANLNAGGSGTAQHKWTQIIARAAPSIKAFTVTGTFTANTSTINYAPASSSAVTVTNTTYNNVTFNSSSSTFTLGAALDVNGTLTITAGALDVSGSNYGITTKSWTDTSTGTFTEQSGTVTFDVAGGTINSNETFENVTINHAGTTTLGAALDLDDTLTLSGGALDVSGSNYGITLKSWTDTGSGTFTEGSGTVTFDVAGGTINSNEAFNSVTINHAGTTTLGAAIDINGTLTLTAGTFDVSASNYRVNAASWTDTGAGTFTERSGVVMFDATGTVNSNEAFNTVAINDGLQAYWKFDETSAGTFSDSSGYGYTITGDGVSGTNNTPQPSTNVPTVNFTDGRSLDFDGTDDGASFTSPVLDDESATTIAVWLRPETISGDDGILRRGDNDVRTYFYLDNGLVTRGSEVSANTFSFRQTSAAISANAWTHVAAVVDPNAAAGSRIQIYVNGSLASMGSETWNGAFASADSGERNIGVVNSGFIDYFDGQMDDLRIYTRALSSTEISRLAAGNQPQTASATTTLGAALDVDGDFLLNAGTFDVSGTNYGVNVAGNWYTNGGVLTSRSGTVTLDSTASGKTILSGSQSFNDLTISGSGGDWTLADAMDVNDDLTLTAGTLAVSSSNYGITVGGDWTDTGAATFTEQTGTVTFDGTGTLSANETFNSVTINSGGTVTLGAALDIADTLTLTAGALDVSGSNYGITLKSWTDTGSGTFTEQSGTVTFDVAGGTINSNETFENVTINHAGTTTLGAALDLDDTLTLSGGALDVSGSNYGITLKSWTDSGAGTFTEGSGTVTFDVAGGTINSNETFENVTINHAGTTTLGAALDLDDTLTISGGALDVSGSNYGITLKSWTDTGSGTFTEGSGTVTFDITGGTINSNETFENVTINHAGTTTLGAALDLDDTLTLSGGALDVSGSNYGITLKSWTDSGAGTFTEQSGTVTFDVAGGTINSNETFENVTINHAGTTTLGAALDLDDTLTLSGGALDVSGSNYGITLKSWTDSGAGTFTEGSGTVTFDVAGGTINSNEAFNSVTINHAGTTTVGADTAIGGTLTITSGTLSASTYTITLSGTGTVFSNGGTFTAGSSTIAITNTSSTSKTFAGGGGTFNALSITGAGTGAVIVTGSNTFATFTINPPKTVTFTAGTTQTITSTFSCTGTSGNVITINSSSSGSAATLSKASGTVSCDYLSVQDSTATGGATWNPGSNSTSVSGNSGWNFDSTAPTTTDDYASDGTWVNSNQSITLTPADAGSGVASTKYCVDTTNTCTVSSGTAYTAAVSITDEGTNYFRYASTDNIGNVQTTVSRTVKIDKTAPVVSVGDDQSKSASFTQNATTSDATSGVASYLWSKVSGSGTVTFGTGTAEDTTIEASESATYVIRLTVTDNAGNQATDDFTLTWTTVVSSNVSVGGSSAWLVFQSVMTASSPIEVIDQVVEPVIAPIIDVGKQIGNAVGQILLPTQKPKPLVLPPIEEVVPQEAPISLQGSWSLLKFDPIKEFLFAPLPGDIRGLATKLPEIQKTFIDTGVVTLNAIVQKFQGIRLKIPGLEQRILARQINVPDIVGGQKLQGGQLIIPNTEGKLLQGGQLGLNGFALPKNTPLHSIPLQSKKLLPTEIVFARTADELIDFNIIVSLNDQGKIEQRINTVSGKEITLAVKPDGPVNSVKGYLLLKSTKQPPTAFETTLNYLTASLAFANPVLSQKVPNDRQVEERLLLDEFEYHDEDADGIYTAKIKSPVPEGEYETLTVMDYKDIRIGTREVRLLIVVDPEGYVYSDMAGGQLRVKGAVISLHVLNLQTKKYELWPAQEYQQENPQVTNETGKYSFLVPDGNYYLNVIAPGYAEYTSDVFTVQRGNGVHMNIPLKRQKDWKNYFGPGIAVLAVIFGLLAYNLIRGKIKKRIKY